MNKVLLENVLKTFFIDVIKQSGEHIIIDYLVDLRLSKDLKLNLSRIDSTALPLVIINGREIDLGPRTWERILMRRRVLVASAVKQTNPDVALSEIKAIQKATEAKTSDELQERILTNNDLANACVGHPLADTLLIEKFGAFELDNDQVELLNAYIQSWAMSVDKTNAHLVRLTKPIDETSQYYAEVFRSPMSVIHPSGDIRLEGIELTGNCYLTPNLELDYEGVLYPITKRVATRLLTLYNNGVESAQSRRVLMQLCAGPYQQEEVLKRHDNYLKHLYKAKTRFLDITTSLDDLGLKPPLKPQSLYDYYLSKEGIIDKHHTIMIQAAQEEIANSIEILINH